MADMDKNEEYKNALLGKNIPILTLDNKWHKLFTQTEISPEIVKKEEEVNELLKKQGKLNNDLKDIHKLKSKLMNEIVSLMGDDADPDVDGTKKQADNKKLIEECNEKLDAYQDDLLDVEKELREQNYELMLMSMDVCYQVLKMNTDEITEIDEWINQIRIELKKNVIRKQEKELYNQELYTYMHDIFGPDVIELFDMQYNPEETKLKRSES